MTTTNNDSQPFHDRLPVRGGPGRRSQRDQASPRLASGGAPFDQGVPPVSSSDPREPDYAVANSDNIPHGGDDDGDCDESSDAFYYYREAGEYVRDEVDLDGPERAKVIDEVMAGGYDVYENRAGEGDGAW